MLPSVLRAGWGAPMQQKKSDTAVEFSDTYHFRLVRKIADGGMGSVHEAVLSGTHGFKKTVVIKTILESLTRDQEFVDMFIGEAKLVADLVHQNICQVYQLGKLENRYYIAMEYVSGVNLKEFLDRHLLDGLHVPPELGTFIISRVCRGLEYAHRKRDAKGQPLGVVHRDVSPKNIMIAADGEVKLTDFGIAKARHLMKDQEGEVLMGKVQYMSPEQAQYQPTDARSDLFSLGVVMFELLTGQVLFGSDSTATAMQNVVYKPIPPPRKLNPAIPEEVERVILKATQRDPAMRYASAGEMGYDLEYAIYHKGYGPTIVTLEKYLRTLFPHLFPFGEHDEKTVTRRDPKGPTGPIPKLKG
jgi:serine/threonine-protein kinase